MRRRGRGPPGLPPATLRAGADRARAAGGVAAAQGGAVPDGQDAPGDGPGSRGGRPRQAGPVLPGDGVGGPADQLLLYHVGELRAAPAPGNAEAVLRHCKPGTTLGEARNLLWQDRWLAIEESWLEGRKGRADALARHASLARLLEIDEDLVHLGFRYLEERLDDEGPQALPGIREVRGKGARRPPRTAEPPRSLAGAVAVGGPEVVRRSIPKLY